MSMLLWQQYFSPEQKMAISDSILSPDGCGICFQLRLDDQPLLMLFLFHHKRHKIALVETRDIRKGAKNRECEMDFPSEDRSGLTEVHLPVPGHSFPPILGNLLLKA